MMSEANKRKLRTAAEVIARLKRDDSFGDRRCEGEAGDLVVLGYGDGDGILGPMEMFLCDYVPISQGGDIPEHRINYFRQESGDVGQDICRFG
jgi:hypothetical protein